VTLFAEIAGRTPANRRGDSSVREAVVANLERLCGLRRGAVLSAPEFGIDDVTLLFHSFPVGLDVWQGRLERSIRQYEPRLRNVQVVPIVSDELDLTLRVEIHALLVTADRAAPTRFAAAIDPQHRVSVR
jgi:type VI secretion system lysozyme-like protein